MTHTRAFIAFLVMAVALAIAPRALAYTPPAMTAHVTDTAHKLTEDERLAIDKKLEDYRLRSTNEIAVFIPASLDGENIDEVGIATGRAWHLGVKGKDNGVLLIIAPAERKARIDVGRGIEGALTDLQSNDIIRNKIRPNLTPGSENYRAAVDAATDAIIADLDKGGASGGSAPARATHKSGGEQAANVLFGLVFFVLMLGVPILLMVAVVRGISRAFSSNNRSAGGGWASGSSWSNDSSWSSGGSSWGSSSGGSSDWGGSSGGGGGDSGFSGGGGDFGGGGSSDSF